MKPIKLFNWDEKRSVIVGAMLGKAIKNIVDTNHHDGISQPEKDEAPQHFPKTAEQMFWKGRVGLLGTQADVWANDKFVHVCVGNDLTEQVVWPVDEMNDWEMEETNQNYCAERYHTRRNSAVNFYKWMQRVNSIATSPDNQQIRQKGFEISMKDSLPFMLAFDDGEYFFTIIKDGIQIHVGQLTDGDFVALSSGHKTYFDNDIIHAIADGKIKCGYHVMIVKAIQLYLKSKG